ncbi:hypothetical protein [Candidatus Thiosymbion oneisti]|uniref:hypothetical protein n=1 Tax=Candidatus Thiosymbion oneisti TaxID=589554 RepID=UPI00105C7165|nr:hypothetical protein [Candidatus Thiosymbion oneisti]
MMDTLKILKKILNKDILLPPPDGNGILRVKERAREAKIKTLDISGVPADSVTFTLDHIPNDKSRRVCFKQLSCYLDPTHKFVNKGCDLVIVSRFKRKWCVMILDLKSDKPRLRETEAQLKNSEAFVAYTLSLIATHYPDDTVFDPYFELVIVTTRTKKGHVYRPNDAQSERGPFREVNPTRYQKGQAKIHFGKLIGV